MRRRRLAVVEARQRWLHGSVAPLARALDSQMAHAAITPRAVRIISLVDLQPGRRYLDIGCGTANYAHLLADRAELDAPPVCADLTTEGPGPVDVAAWPEQLPFGDASFDAITSLYFVRRFDDDVVRAFAYELRRVLAPGGSALVMEVAPVRASWLDRFHRWVVSGGCPVVDLRGWGRLGALFADVGFDAIDLVNVGPFLLPPIPRVGVLCRRAPSS